MTYINSIRSLLFGAQNATFIWSNLWLRELCEDDDNDSNIETDTGHGGDDDGADHIGPLVSM